MRNRMAVSFLALVLVIGCTASQPTTAPEPLPTAAPVLARDEWDGEIIGPNQGCTTVYATDGEQILGGNNEDSIEPLTKVWFVPATEDTFGMVLFGYGDYRAQGGMNDQGLFFDFLSVPRELRISLEGRQPYTGTNYIVYDAMLQCANVACVVDMFERYYDQEIWSMQVFYGDATGESAIIEPQAILRQSGGYQVATNFYQSTVAPESRPQTCPRYRTASEMLEGPSALSVEFMRDVMAAVHQEERWVRTVYTNVYDLVNRLVYLYYFSDYEHVVVIDLEDELAKGAHAYDLPALFPPNPEAQELYAPALSGYDELIRSRRVEVDPAFLAAYVGEYVPAGETPSAPGEWASVVPYGTSLLMVFPDSQRYELFPQSETSFFVVAWDKTDERFRVQFEVDFGLDEDTGQVIYMDFVFGPGDAYLRNDRLSLDSYVPYIPTAEPSPTPGPEATAEPTATAEPAPAASATGVADAQAPSSPDPGFPWGWIIVPVVLLVAAVVGWAVIRQRRSPRR